MLIVGVEWRSMLKEAGSVLGGLLQEEGCVAL